MNEFIQGKKKNRMGENSFIESLEHGVACELRQVILHTIHNFKQLGLCLARDCTFTILSKIVSLIFPIKKKNLKANLVLFSKHEDNNKLSKRKKVVVGMNSWFPYQTSRRNGGMISCNVLVFGCRR